MANINVELVMKHDLTIFRVEGELSADEILKYSIKHYGSYPTKFVLWDATKGSASNIGVETFRQIAIKVKRHMDKRSGGKTALVSRSDIDFGLSRMYSTFAEFEKLPVKYGAFRNIDDAMRWLRE